MDAPRSRKFSLTIGCWGTERVSRLQEEVYRLVHRLGRREHRSVDSNPYGKMILSVELFKRNEGSRPPRSGRAKTAKGAKRSSAAKRKTTGGRKTSARRK